MSDTFQLGALTLTGGNPYRLTLGFDLSDQKAITSAVQSLFVDGSLVTGSFSDNRLMKLTVCVTAANRLALAVACDALAVEVNKPTNLITWTPADGLPTVFDTFRGQMTTLWPSSRDALNRRFFQLDIPALPFARSPSPTQIVGTSTSVQLGNFAQVTEYAYAIPNSADTTPYGYDETTVPVPTTGTVYAEQTSPAPIDGAGCMQLSLGGYHSTSNITSTLAKVGPIAGSWNLAATTNLAIAVATLDAPQNIQVQVKLGDSHGAFQTFTGNIARVQQFNQTAWSYGNLDLSVATIDLTTITSWTLWFGTYNWNVNLGSYYYLGLLRAYSASASLSSTARGAVYKLSGVKGSARSPAAVEIDRGGGGGNLLPAADASLETGLGTWVGTTRCTVAQSNAQALDGTHSLSMTSTGTGFMEADNTDVAVAASNVYTAAARFRAAATPRTCQITIVWSDASHAFISASATGSATDTTSGWTMASITATSPSNAAFAHIDLETNNSATSEVHYVDQIQLNAGLSTVFTAGTPGPTLSSALVYRAPSDALLTTPVLAALTAGAVTTTAPSTFAGTYRIVLAQLATLTAGGTVTIQQKVNGSNVGTLWTSNPTVLVGASVNYLDAGTVTLPLVDVPADASNVTYVVTSSNTNPTEVMFLDTRGFLVWMQTLAAASQCVFIDAPKPGVQSGAVYAGQVLNRQDATSTAATTIIDGGLTVEPGDNYLLAYCPDGAPANVNVTYYPHWLLERTS